MLVIMRIVMNRFAESLDLFDFAPGAHTPQEYGKYMIQQSGHFDYDENLDAFYDYEKYGLQRMGEEDGMFTDRGYVAYKGYTIPLFIAGFSCSVIGTTPAATNHWIYSHGAA